MHPIGWLIVSCWLICYVPTLASVLFMGGLTWGLIMLVRGIFRI